MDSQKNETSLLSKAGGLASALAKHILWRSILWGVIGFIVGAVCVTLSFVIGVRVMGRGSEILAFVVFIPLTIPFLGGGFFFLHGVQRGIAKSILSFEKQLGLVHKVVAHVTSLLEEKIPVLQGLSTAEFKSKVNQALRQYADSDQSFEVSGSKGWAMKKSKKIIVSRIQGYLVKLYQQEEKLAGPGGSISLSTLGEKATNQISEKLEGIVFSPLNKQAVVFMFLYVLVAGGWWYWLFLILKLFLRNTPSS